MNIQFSNQREKKDELVKQLLYQNSSPQNSLKAKHNNAIKIKLFQEGNILYLPQGFNMDLLHQTFEKWFSEEKKVTLQFISEDSVFQYIYKPTQGLRASMGITGSFSLLITIFEDQFIFLINPSDWMDKIEKPDSKILQFGKLLQENYEDEIIALIKNQLLSQIPFERFAVQTSNRFIQPLSEHENFWIAVHQQSSEILLAWLEVSEIKKCSNSEINKRKLKWKYFLTSQSAGLIAFNEFFELEFFKDLSQISLHVKPELGRNTVIADDCEWLSKLSNDSLFSEVAELSKLSTLDRIREIARMNWISASKNKESKQVALSLLDFIIKKAEVPFDQFTRIFIEYFDHNNQQLLSTFSNEKLSILIKSLLEDDNSEQKFIDWFAQWDIKYNDAAVIVQILLNISNSPELMSRVLKIHKQVRELITKECSDKLALAVFDIEYCRHLLACGEKKEAVKVIEQNLEVLPDESISEILPFDDISPTGAASGQIIRITFLDLLFEAKEELKSEKYLREAAMLQPLVLKRMEVLYEIAQKDLKEKALEVIKCFQTEGLSSASINIELSPKNSIDSDTADILKHPLERKGNLFDSLQKWIASVKKPDYSVIKAYSELISLQKYPEQYHIIEEIKNYFGMPEIEVYISRGEKSVGLRSFQGKPAFLILGGDHFDKGSPYYLTVSELKFAVASEISHLYFKHSLITSGDIWRGAVEKGNMVVDALLSIIPVFGFIGKGVQMLTRLKTFAKVVQGAEKVTRITSQGKNIITVAEQAGELYKQVKTKDFKEDKELELLASSRIMLLTADRAGLFFCGDLKSAVRSMFLINKGYYEVFPTATLNGINEVLVSKDNENGYKFSELSIRLSHLIRFYISQEFERTS